VVVVGVSYKPNIADVRETPAELVIDLLRLQGAETTWHDELVGKWRGELSSQIQGSDIAVVLMLHESFDRKNLSNIPYIFDCTGQLNDVDGI
jgi:UDP-N-acetyl-D-glucosamine dehydrogenase